MNESAFVAVDWGTSSFRAWAMSADGKVLAEHKSSAGMSSLRPEQFEDALEAALAELQISDGIPALICGMAGAAQGWQMAPYVDLPTALDGLPEHCVSPAAQRREVHILPGLAQRDAKQPDVMRGEETLLLGAALAQGIDGLVCMPGTHSKWVRLAGGRVEHFATSMTGECFGLLAHKSTLAPMLADASGSDSAAFVSGVEAALNQPTTMLNQLFTVRAAPLLGFGSDATALRERLSGLLIGLEIAGSCEHLTPGDRVSLISDGVLQDAYALAFDTASIEYHTLDATAAAQAGLYHCARSLWPARFGDEPSP